VADQCVYSLGRECGPEYEGGLAGAAQALQTGGQSRAADRPGGRIRR